MPHGNEIGDEFQPDPNSLPNVQSHQSAASSCNQSSPPGEYEIEDLLKHEQEMMAVANGGAVDSGRGNSTEFGCRELSRSSGIDVESSTSAGLIGGSNRIRNSLVGSPQEQAMLAAQLACKPVISVTNNCAAGAGAQLQPAAAAADGRPAQVVTGAIRTSTATALSRKHVANSSSGGDGGCGRATAPSVLVRSRSIQWFRRYGTSAGPSAPEFVRARFEKPVEFEWKNLPEYSLRINAVVLDEGDSDSKATEAPFGGPRTETVRVAVSNSLVQQRLMGGLSCAEFNQRYKLAKKNKDKQGKADKQQLSETLRAMNENLHFGRKGKYFVMELEWTGIAHADKDVPFGKIVAVRTSE